MGLCKSFVVCESHTLVEQKGLVSQHVFGMIVYS